MARDGGADARGMELEGLEPPTSWVRSLQTWITSGAVPAT